MIAKDNVTGVVLAGGRSSRFGSDKAMQHWRGETFLTRAVKLLRPICAEVLISGGKEEYASEGCRLLKDRYNGCGPLSGIHAALTTCRTEYALFLTCDMPLMERAPLLRMLQQPPAFVIGWQPGGAGGGIFPLLVSSALADEVEEALKNGNYSIRRSLCERVGAWMLDIPDEWATLFANINRKEDLNNALT